jgi:hypothetical protein
MVSIIDVLILIPPVLVIIWMIYTGFIKSYPEEEEELRASKEK